MFNPAIKAKKGIRLIHQKYIPEIMAMPETATLRDFMHAHTAFILDVDDLGINLDADTPEDIHFLSNYMNKGHL